MDAIVLQIQDGALKNHQAGVELKIQDGCAHKSRPCWKRAHQLRQRTWDRSHGFPWRPESRQGHANMSRNVKIDTYSGLWY